MPWNLESYLVDENEQEERRWNEHRDVDNFIGGCTVSLKALAETLWHQKKMSLSNLK
jgi:hypothetical protein